MDPKVPPDRGFDVPPCVRLGQPLNPCAAARYQEQVLSHLDLFGDWHGWKFRGKFLISPDGSRISRERLRGIIFMDEFKRKVVKEKPGEPKVVHLLQRTK